MNTSIHNLNFMMSYIFALDRFETHVDVSLTNTWVKNVYLSISSYVIDIIPNVATTESSKICKSSLSVPQWFPMSWAPWCHWCSAAHRSAFRTSNLYYCMMGRSLGPCQWHTHEAMGTWFDCNAKHCRGPGVQNTGPISSAQMASS